MEHGYRFAIVFAIVSGAVAMVTLAILMVDNRATARRNQESHSGKTVTVMSAADPTK
jgi:hypothetical protein